MRCQGISCSHIKIHLCLFPNSLGRYKIERKSFIAPSEKYGARKWILVNPQLGRSLIFQTRSLLFKGRHSLYLPGIQKYTYATKDALFFGR